MTSPLRKKLPITAPKHSTKIEPEATSWSSQQLVFGCGEEADQKRTGRLWFNTTNRLLKKVLGKPLLGSALSITLCFAGTSLTTTLGTAQAQAMPQQSTSASPSRFVADGQARPIQQSSIPSNQLRWRRSNEAPTKPAAPVATQASYTAPATELNGANSGLNLNEPRRLASPQELDPVEDPFGDRGDAGSARLPAPPASTQAGSLQWQSAAETTSGQPNTSSRTTRPQTNAVSTDDGSSWSTNPSPSPRSRIRPIRQVSQRNQERAIDCETARDILNGSPLAAIDLNVTPFRAEIESTETGMVFRDASQLSEIIESRFSARRNNQAAREWTDRNGNALTSGWFYLIRNHNVTLRDENGSSMVYHFYQLSAADQAYVLREWELPSECPPVDEYYVERQWIPQTFTWKASALCHKPLYFEDIQLERYGHTAGPFLQPIKSGAHFFANIATLPYQMGIHPPTECSYALGFYRPGDCAPWLVDPLPLSLRGALFQASAATGAAFAFP